MTRRGLRPLTDPSGAAVEALAPRGWRPTWPTRPVTANILAARRGPLSTGMVPDEMADELRANLLDPSIHGAGDLSGWPPRIAVGVHDERIVARDFESWLAGPRDRERVRRL